MTDLPMTPEKPAAGGTTYDVFLSHNGDDRAAVLEVARRLREASIEPFLDAWHLVPGEPWQEALEQALDASRSCAVFVGPSGLGTWENAEMRAALSVRASRPEYRVIPVILPGALLPERGRLPRFLAQHTWVDFRPGLDDAAAFDRLVNGIRGLAPDTGEVAPDEGRVVNPFRGLEVFDEEHAPYFFGREALTQYLVEHLREDRFLGVIGPSGSGKSSVVRAGLVPRIRAGDLPGSAGWTVAIFRPGPHPLEAMAARLASALMPDQPVLEARDAILEKLRGGERGLHIVVESAIGEAGVDQRALVIIDQFEEIFTLCHDDAERSAFVDSLLYASTLAGGRTVVVVTMRADFFGKVAMLPTLAARMGEHDVLVPPMDEEELRRAMIQPAELAGLQFEKGLVDTILENLGSEPGALPLLQHTLLELFEGRRGRWLTIDRYHEIGGVRGAIAQRAEAIYANLTPEQQAATRRVLLRLTEPGAGTEDTRRRAPLSELLPTEAPPDAVEAVVNRLADARLVVVGETETGEEVIDVAHEALIRGWPRLQSWIDENPAGLRIHRRLTETSTEWAAAGREQSWLFTGQRLDETLSWAGANPDDLNDSEHEFLEASELARTREETARRRRVQLAFGGATVAIALISVAALVAFLNYREASASRTELGARLLASEGQRQAAGNPLLGLRLELEGLATAGDGTAAADQIRGIVEDQLVTGRTDALGTGVGGAWITGGDRYAIVVDEDGGSIWRLADRTRIATLPNTPCNVDEFEGADVGVALLSYGDNCFGEEGPTEKELRRLSDGAVIDQGGDLVMTVPSPGYPAAVLSRSGGDASTGMQSLMSLESGRILSTASDIRPLTAPDRAVLIEDGMGQLVETSEGTVVADLGRVQDIQEDPSSPSTFVAVNPAGDCTLHETATGRPVGVAMSRCSGLTVSMDGSLAALYSAEGVAVIDVSSGRQVETLGPEVWGVRFSPGSPPSTLVTMSNGAKTRLLSTDDGSEIVAFEGAIAQQEDPDQISGAVRYSPDGRLVFVRLDGNSDLTDEERATLRIAATGQPISLESPPGEDGEAGALWDLEFSPDPVGTFANAYFMNNTRRLFRSSDMSRIDLDEGILNVTFMPPPIGLYAVLYPYERVEAFRWSDDTPIGTLPKGVAEEIVPVPGSDPPAFLFNVDEGRAGDVGKPVIRDINGDETEFEKARRVTLSPDPTASWFVHDGAVWSRLPKHVRLASLPRSSFQATFDSTGRRLFVDDFANGAAYLVDMEWLADVKSHDLKALSDSALIDLVCRGPAGQSVAERDLVAAVRDLRPTACAGSS